MELGEDSLKKTIFLDTRIPILLKQVTKFRPTEMAKTVVFELLDSPKLISRKI